MKVLMVGGGSGGHITPAVAVLRELLALRPRAKVEFWTDRKYYKNVVKITTELGFAWGEEDRNSGRRAPYIRVRKVAAGKFRRYAGWKLPDYLKHLWVTFRDLVVGNVVGLLGFLLGMLQSFVRFLPRAGRPDVIFLKGGFVGLPVGIVARFYRIPYVVHESDAVPGLANRILMKHAAVVATGVPGEGEAGGDGVEAGGGSVVGAAKSSSGPALVWTGTPIAPEFRKVTEAQQKQLKKAFGFDTERPLVVVTGGSQGAASLNNAVREILPELLKSASVGLVAGRKHYEDVIDLKKYENWDKAKLQSDFRMWEFCATMNELMGAADVVVSRAGATTIAELAALGKSVILVPFERLPGGHQVKNAERLVKKGGAKMILNRELEQKPNLLLDELRHLLRSPRERADLAEKVHEEAKPEAGKQLAEILLEVAG